MSPARQPRGQKRRASRTNDNRLSGNAPRNKHANRRLQRPHNRRRNNKRNEQRLSRAAPALYCLNFLFPLLRDSLLLSTFCVPLSLKMSVYETSRDYRTRWTNGPGFEQKWGTSRER